MSFKKNIARGFAAAATIAAMSMGGFAVAAPAMAADGAREAGPLMINASGGNFWYVTKNVADGSSSTSRANLASVIAAGEVVHISYPALGSSGPIILEKTGLGAAGNKGKCAVAVSPDTVAMKWEKCDGSALQTWNNVSTPFATSDGKGVQLTNTAPGVTASRFMLGGSYVMTGTVSSSSYGFMTSTFTAPAPSLEAPLVITKPSNGAQVSTKGVQFAGTGEPGALVQIRDKGGKVIATATVRGDGGWDVTVDALPEGSAPLTLAAGSQTITVNVTITAPAPDPEPEPEPEPEVAVEIVLSSPADGSVIGTDEVVFEGTAKPGSSVVITDVDNNIVGTGTADAVTGAFSITAGPFAEGPQSITITADDKSQTFGFVAVEGGEEGTPLMDPTFAGFGVLTLLAAGAAGVVVRRRRSLVDAA